MTNRDSKPVGVTISPECLNILEWLGDGNKSFGIEQAAYIVARLSIELSRATEDTPLDLSEFITEVQTILATKNYAEQVTPTNAAYFDWRDQALKLNSAKRKNLIKEKLAKLSK